MTADNPRCPACLSLRVLGGSTTPAPVAAWTAVGVLASTTTPALPNRKAMTMPKLTTSRSHPIRVLLDAAAAGHPPASKETSALVEAVTEGMTTRDRELWRRRFEKACRACALAYDGGEMGNARRHARSAAVELADSLEASGAEPWSAPDDTPTDPAAIVNAIPRF